MRAAVVGAGIVGVTSAFELAMAGHEVTVFERSGSVAAEASFANAGVLSPGLVSPKIAPGTPRAVVSQLWSDDGAVRLRTPLPAGLWSWGWAWARACSPRVEQANHERLKRLAFFSRQRLHDISLSLKLQHERTQGVLLLLRSARDLARVQPQLQWLSDAGVSFQTLNAAQCAVLEPGLDTETPLHAGICLPEDGVGNCRQFAHLLRHVAQRRGASFRFHTEVQEIEPGPRPALTHRYVPPPASPGARSTEHTDTQPMAHEALTEEFDAVLVCAAMGARRLLAPLGLGIPLLALHGHSITAPLRLGEDLPPRGPHSGLIDERHRVTISRLGTRVRVSGGVEVGGTVAEPHPAAFDTLYKVLNDWFPGAAKMEQSQRWKGVRATLPDGAPVIGYSGIEGVWLNLGHGDHGWVLACGCASLLTEQLSGRTPSIDTAGLDVSRWRA